VEKKHGWNTKEVTRRETFLKVKTTSWTTNSNYEEENLRDRSFSGVMWGVCDLEASIHQLIFNPGKLARRGERKTPNIARTRRGKTGENVCLLLVMCE
jgi:hypothetical protein